MFRALKNEVFAAVLIGWVGVILRAWRILNTPLWYDESFTAILARLPFSDMIQATRGDVHPPLYYALVSASEGVTIRLYSLVFSVAGLVIFYLILRRLDLSPAGRLLSMGFMAFTEPMIWYAGEARMYSLLVLLVLGVWYAILLRRWWTMGALSALMLYTHNYAPLYLAVLASIAILSEAKKVRHYYVHPAPDGGQPEGYGQTEDVIRSFLAAGLVYVPWFFYGMLGQMGGFSSHWTQEVSILLQFTNIIGVVFGRFMPNGLQIIGVLLISSGLVLLAAWSFKNHRLGLYAIMVGPAALMVVISTLWRPIYLPRGLLASMPAMYILLSESISKAPLHRRLVLIGIIMPLFVSATLMHVGAASVSMIKFDPVAYRVDLQIEPGVPLVHLSDFSMVNWWATRTDVDNRRYQSTCEPQPGSQSVRTTTAMNMPTITEDELPGRYYIVGSLGGMTSLCLEQEHYRMIAGSQPVFVNTYQYGLTGVWLHEQ